jgi:hypothetical protein
MQNKGCDTMKFKEDFVISNPFKMYRYEVIGAYRDFIFTEAQVPLRASMDEDGYDDVTDHDKFSDFSDEIKHRFLPFIRKITEEEYIENHSKYLFEDIRITQGWATSPSSNLINSLSNVLSLNKISENIFIRDTIDKYYIKKDGTEFSVADIDSLEILFEYFYHRKNDCIFVQIKNVKFNCEFDTKDNSYDMGFYVPSELISFYFGIDRTYFKGDIVNQLLQKEFLFTPAMLFDSNLYFKIKNKINEVEYKVSGER